MSIGRTVAVTGDNAAHALNVKGRYVRITNRGGGSVFLGGADVDETTHGYELKTNEFIEVDCAIEELYACAAALGSLGVLAVRRPQSA